MCKEFRYRKISKLIVNNHWFIARYICFYYRVTIIWSIREKKRRGICWDVALLFFIIYSSQDVCSIWSNHGITEITSLFEGDNSVIWYRVLDYLSIGVFSHRRGDLVTHVLLSEIHKPIRLNLSRRIVRNSRAFNSETHARFIIPSSTKSNYRGGRVSTRDDYH